MDDTLSVVSSFQMSPTALVLLNAVLAFMMFGVSLGLRPADFGAVLRRPVAPVTGLIAQFLLLPALTCLATYLLDVSPGLALGMILVSCCPGGTFSNVMTWIGRASVATSVSMTAVSSLAAVVMTPLNFALYGSLNPHTRELLQEIALPAESMITLVLLVLALPMLVGMVVGAHFPNFVRASERYFRTASLLVFLLFVVISFSKHWETALQVAGAVLLLVVAHNALAFWIGDVSGRVMRLPVAERRAVTMEVGIQNSGLALAILFTFYPGAGEMLVVAGFWGVWHLVGGLALAGIWNYGERKSHSQCSSTAACTPEFQNR
ncbi:Sodium Bile acid symporter family protein [Microbulbifer aggregans]|uniref:Sodium Bile acid symporter family protein n=1 Tax=Microbulbifer aggregans TaxID=1769779 RepID=A0A1C9W918_9GAMM|nr:bile acid:sodium symporter family protein [Microbulbifer aggregans]AOS97640.1 Sodium Bile acid symporter family protein [Microbulbifer aggregans]